MFNNIYQRLKNTFNMSYLRFIFKYTALGQFLNQNNNPSLFQFLNIYFSTWWKGLWIKLFIKDKDLRYQFEQIIKAVTLLRQKDEQGSIGGLFEISDEFFEIHFRRKKTTFRIIANHHNPLEFATNIVKNNESITAIDSILYNLESNNLATSENIEAVIKHKAPQSMQRGLETLQEVNLLSKENREFIFKYQQPLRLAYMIKDSPKIFHDNREFITNHPHPYGLTKVINFLQLAQILNQTSLDLINAHYNCDDINNERGFIYILDMLNFPLINLLTQDNFNSLMNPDHVILISPEGLRYWQRIPPHLLTQENFERLLVASRARDALRQLDNVINQIIGIPEPVAQVAANFNNGQSTHTTSVHRSVSESATKLRNSYGRGTNLEAKIKEIKAYVQDLDGSPNHQAAKRCITRITARDYFFTDSSDVSTRQLLALAFTAIHDDDKRIGTLEDAKALFIQALYEIQRGYNLNDVGHELGGEDRPICPGGTFNKIMEKLNGIHTDVKIYYITTQGANLKFQKLAAERALDYLKTIASPKTADGYQQCKTILDQIQQENSLEPIWDKIKDIVAKEIWEEFHEAYQENPQHKSYTDLINYGGQFLYAPERLSEIEKQLLASDGYQQLIGLQIRNLSHTSPPSIIDHLHQHSLWANRHASQAFQEAFDKQFGLAIIPKP
jgi:hypothetical protein